MPGQEEQLVELDAIDAQVLDSIADDHYGLYEVADYFAQLLPAIGRQASDALSRSRVKEYVKAGFANVFRGNFVKGNFRRVEDELTVLDDEESWRRPTGLDDLVVAITATREAEGPVRKAWPHPST